MHHLHEVAGADGADMGEAAIGDQRLEDRLQVLDVRLVAAGHDAVAVIESPQASGDSGIDECDIPLPEQLAVAL